MIAGELVAERFVVERLAGSGGMGAVWRARDRRGGQPVALKVLATAQNADRFTREAHVLAEVHHPGIVRYIDHGTTAAGELYLAMEWLDGEDLAKRLARSGLTVDEAVALVRRAAEALGAAHQSGIVHRDVKPSNLFLPDGDLTRVKVLDFGIARLSAEARAPTRTGVLLGTPGYMAPEQARGGRDLDARADVFALGCVLFECLTGRAAFVGEHIMALLAKILLEEAPRVSELRDDVPGALDELVARMMSKSPEARPRDGAEVGRALAALGDLDGSAPVSSVSQRGALTGTEQRLLSVVLASAIEKTTPASVEATAERGVTPVGEPTLIELPPPPPSSDPERREGSSPTLAPGATTGLFDRLARTARTFGGALERLADGSAVVTLAGAGSATDQVQAAARCALALRAVVPEVPMALATGRGVLAGRWPVGEAIDRAARMLGKDEREPRPGAARPVRLDEVTAGLLDVRFEIGGDKGGLFLRGERDLVENARTVLGKATPCVGRDRELGVLAGLFEECVAEPRARAVLVVGPAGVGKSRVRYELLRRLAQGTDAPELWLCRGDPVSGGSPFGMIAPALRRAAGILDGEPLAVRQQKLRARVARHVEDRALQRVSQFLGELASVPFDDAQAVELRSARQDAVLMNDQVRRAWEDFLGAETTSGPVLIVLEDLHWGDLPTVKLLDSALRNLADRPWMVLALARPEVRELFPHLWGERDLQEVRLGELTRRGSEKLVRHLLGDRLDAPTVQRLVERAGGNPFYLEELIRAAAEGDTAAAPQTVLAVVQARLERLEDDARRLLRAASVFGQVFWQGGVLSLLGEQRATIGGSWLGELIQREVIVPRGQGRFPAEEEFSFRHALVRDAAYAMLTESDRRLGHKLAGEWLERAGESEAMVLAEHFERGGELGRAVGWYRRAAEQALAGNDFRASLQRAERALACGAEGEVRGAIRLTCAEAHRWCGEFAESERCGLEALGMLGRGSPLWFSAAGEVATAAGKLYHRELLEDVGERLRNLGDGQGAGGPEVAATACCAFQLYFHGLYALAGSLLDRIERIDAEVRDRDPAIRARIQQARSSRAMYAGDAGEYLEMETAAVESFEQAGDVRSATMQRGYAGYACLEMGAWAEAEQQLRAALEGGERLGLPNVVASAKHNLGRAIAHLGRFDEARRMEQQAIAEFGAQGDKRLEAGSHLYMGEILLALGDIGAAELELELALVNIPPPLLPQALALRAQVLLADDRAPEALQTIERALVRMAEVGSVEEGEALIRLSLAEALYATGRRDEARHAVAQARDRVMERADKIRDPARRRCFLDSVPENARTLALARALGA